MASPLLVAPSSFDPSQNLGPYWYWCSVISLAIIMGGVKQ
jgi:hypothetical protein